MISFWTRLLDLISPRLCVVCGRRLDVTEEGVCSKCYLHLPRTGYQHKPYDNPMAKAYWGRMPIERAAALYYHESHAESANIIYALKYKSRPEIGEAMGRMTARELAASGFFEGIDGLVPVPLARKRLRQRGYNQSMMLAKGISEATGLPIYERAVERIVYEDSQTHKIRWERNENVEDVFRLADATAISGKHLLLIDDVVTTGATTIACGKVLLQAGNVRLSILSLAFAKS